MTFTANAGIKALALAAAAVWAATIPGLAGAPEGLKAGSPVQLEAWIGRDPVSEAIGRLCLALRESAYDRKYSMRWRRPVRVSGSDGLAVVGHVQGARGR